MVKRNIKFVRYLMTAKQFRPQPRPAIPKKEKKEGKEDGQEEKGSPSKEQIT